MHRIPCASAECTRFCSGHNPAECCRVRTGSCGRTRETGRRRRIAIIATHDIMVGLITVEAARIGRQTRLIARIAGSVFSYLFTNIIRIIRLYTRRHRSPSRGSFHHLGPSGSTAHTRTPRSPVARETCCRGSAYSRC